MWTMRLLYLAGIGIFFVLVFVIGKAATANNHVSIYCQPSFVVHRSYGLYAVRPPEPRYPHKAVLRVSFSRAHDLCRSFRSA